MTITSTQSVITAEVSTSTKDQFQEGKQSSDRNWDNQSITAEKSDTTSEMDDQNWEDIVSRDEQIKPKRKYKRSKVKFSCSGERKENIINGNGKDVYLQWIFMIVVNIIITTHHTLELINTIFQQRFLCVLLFIALGGALKVQTAPIMHSLYKEEKTKWT